MITKKCVVCGTVFDCYPSDNKVTCSNACRREHRRRIQTGRSIQWSQESRRRKSAEGQKNGLKMGTAAAQASPIAGRFETNQAAKVWTLVDPSGQEIVVRNLLLWPRENTERFGKPPGDRSAQQIASGFRAVAQTLAGRRGAPGKPRGAMTYLGWTLKGPPERPEGEKTDRSP